ncbi:MAG: alpha/beta hydrolase [Pseudomonadota bacterium]
MIKYLAMLFASVALASSAYAQRSVTIPQDSRTFEIGESSPFEETPFTLMMKEGVDSEGAVYRYEVPVNWNGDLVIYAHGFRGRCADELPALTVDNVPIREYLLEQGFAWAASSYAKNCYDVKDGVESSNRLARIFSEEVGEPERRFMMGFSMGGHITGAAIEMFPNVRCPEGEQGETCTRFAEALGQLVGGVRYDGAAPMCGVMGDVELFDYFGDFGTAAEALAAEVDPSIVLQFPQPADYAESILPSVLDALFVEYPSTTTAQGDSLRDLVRQRSGGDRPIFDIAYSFYMDTLFGLAGSDGSIDGVLSGNIYDNRRRVYQFDNDPSLTAAEQALNDNILRIQRTPGVNINRNLKLKRVPEISGLINIPVISVHNLGDLFVPFSMQQIYARDVAAQQRSELLVSRATRAIVHCEFSPQEVIQTFDDLVQWVDSGVKPDGDDVLDPEVVADPFYGCQFTTGTTTTTPEILRSEACAAGQ